ncbi:MAG: hypothetical protein J6M93_02630 [Succinivibrio sp.]|nr:hypothetical protein [Succinivibrio sp.]
MTVKGFVHRAVTVLTVLLSVPFCYAADESSAAGETQQTAQNVTVTLPEINYKNCSDSEFLNSLLNSLANAQAASFTKKQLQDIHSFTDKCLLILKQN